jgi:hypothetical protein
MKKIIEQEKKNHGKQAIPVPRMLGSGRSSNTWRYSPLGLASLFGLVSYTLPAIADSSGEHLSLARFLHTGRDATLARLVGLLALYRGRPLQFRMMFPFVTKQRIVSVVFSRTSRTGEYNKIVLTLHMSIKVPTRILTTEDFSTLRAS